MNDLIARARRPTRTIEESIRLVNPLTDALDAEQDLRDRVVQLDRELATSRAAHEVTAQERDRATTELAIMRAWVAQARPVVEAVREWQRARLSVLSSGVDDYASRVSDFGTAQNRIMTIALPPKETP